MVGRMVAPEIASCRKSPGGGESWRVLHRPDRFLRCGYVSGAVGFGHSIPPSCAKNEIWRQPYRFRFAEQRTVWGRHSSARFHEGQNEQMAKFGPMVEYCSTLPSRFHFSKFSCFFDAGNRLLCVILIRYTKKENKKSRLHKASRIGGSVALASKWCSSNRLWKIKVGFCFIQLPPAEPKAWWSSSILPEYRYCVRLIRLSLNMFEHFDIQLSATVDPLHQYYTNDVPFHQGCRTAQ